MLKRLIEVALPLKEVSEQSAREKTIRHGHISTLHIWWARRPLAACRAAVFASLIPDPDDPECPESFRTLVMEQLGRSEFKPKGEVNGKPVEDTSRNRCLEFIKHLVKWENSNKPEYIDPARKLIATAHKFLHRGADGNAPTLLDSFAGGGAIPLEALRLGCEAQAIDINPVAHLIELCTLAYPQKYGQPDSRPVPDHIKRLIANKAKKKAKGGSGLYDGDNATVEPVSAEVTPDVEITEAEYRKNPLAADVKYWGTWVLQRVRIEVDQFYPVGRDGDTPIAYLWARTVRCPNPSCRAAIPLIRQLWLCKKAKRKVALRIVTDHKSRQCRYLVVEGKEIDFDPSQGTMRKGKAACPFCQAIADGSYLREESKAERMNRQLMAVVGAKPGSKGKTYRIGTKEDEQAFQWSVQSLEELKKRLGRDACPSEPTMPDRPSPNSRGLSAVVRYGFEHFGKFFNQRQTLTLALFAHHIRQVSIQVDPSDEGYSSAVSSLLAMNLDRLADLANNFCRFEPVAQCPRQLFGRQAVPMIWDYAEGVPVSGYTCSWQECLRRTLASLSNVWSIRASCAVAQGNAMALPIEAGCLDAVVTDPPYYDSVPYSDLSDFFYVWLKRMVGHLYPHLFRTPVTPKAQELIAYYGTGKRKIQKPPEWYEAGMESAFSEMFRVVSDEGVVCVMFAHKTTIAWESLIRGLCKSGLVVTASWPIHTEMKTRLVARNAAALASSVTLVCRKRSKNTGSGLWDDVRNELQQVARGRLDFFWSQGIRGADFFISAIGPSLSVFGKYERVTKLSGEEVTVGQFLDDVRGLVTNYALAKILKTTHTANIDSESRFYVVWKWSYGEVKMPADESFKLAQALGMNTEIMWDRTGVLEKSGENVQAVPVAKRMKIKDLGEPNANGTPASLIDVLHRLCVFRDKGDTAGMAEFLARSG